MILTLCTMLPTLVTMDSWKTQMISIQKQEKAQTRRRMFFKGRTLPEQHTSQRCWSSQREHNSASCRVCGWSQKCKYQTWCFFTFYFWYYTHQSKKLMIISSTSLARFGNGCGEHHWMNFILSLACFYIFTRTHRVTV